MEPRVLTVVGARPQFIKAAVVSAALERAGVEELLVHTGQHYDAAMSAVFFEQLGLPTPSRHLGIGGVSHGAMTGRMLEALEVACQETRPDYVLVYGDTNSTLAGALAAVKLAIPVAHVEAGMRSFNRAMPEEINRVLTDHASSLLLVTSQGAADLLGREGIRDGVHVVGDVMCDAARVYGEASAGHPVIRADLPERFGLVTLHRAENVDHEPRMRAIVEGLTTLSRQLPLVLPLHPRTEKQLRSFGMDLPASILRLGPVGYLEMLALERRAALVLTDSGGVQKEALYAGRPCVTMRDETEWTETVDAGWNVLVGADPDRIVAESLRMLSADWGEPPRLYGHGDAADRIARILRDARAS